MRRQLRGEIRNGSCPSVSKAPKPTAWNQPPTATVMSVSALGSAVTAFREDARLYHGFANLAAR
jgi:hypothetical protein